MTVIFILLPITVLIAGAFVGAFALAARRGQFDDLRTPGVRVLFEDDPAPPRR